MSYQITTAFMGLVRQFRRPTNGLLGFFRSTPGNITRATVIEYDQMTQYGKTAKAKGRPAETTMNRSDVFRNVSYTPPIYKESAPFTLETLVRRQPGWDKYSVPEQTALIAEFLASTVSPLIDKIANAELLQVAKILHGGTIPFRTESLGIGGLDDIDFSAPGTNFATLSNAGTDLYWTDSTAKAITHLENHCRTIVNNAYGKTAIRNIVFGYKAWNEFISLADTQEKLNVLRMNIGDIAVREKDAMTGMTYLGTFQIGGHMVDFWMFDETYISPADDSTVTDYLDPESVYFIGDGDYQLYHAGVDVIEGIQDQNLLRVLPADGFIRDIGNTIATSMYVRTVADTKNSSVEIEVTKCPLYVPRTPNTFGRLTVMA